MNEFYVALSEKPIANSIEQATQDSNVTLLEHKVSQFVPKVTFAVDANVRYVKILQGTPNEILQIAEVEVFSDEPDEGVLLSRYGHATQSSVYQNKMAALAIDGNYSGRYQDGSVFHTQVSGDTAPWWQIDLGESYPLSHMKLFNRSDCCMDRLSDINILLSDQPFGDADFSLLETRSDITILPVYTQMLEINVVQIPLGYRARYVRIQKTQGSMLSLAEVDIYSDVANPLVNVTNNAVVSQ
ncbi:MAG: discoidin domain-containing protein, partial [Gammaproteobacteria bacterium]|nr:discoidin domain-containing protein [Gammaproteobacteria bacterium]